jgi:glycosyltransferase involved in cell wall biosynthesis/SAM-dependent methyltransferase
VSPAVSAVICFLDAERFLREAIGSVYAQGFPDWELLLVDDGSRDGSRAIAEAAARERPERVRVLEHPGRANRGISASRNLGLRAARGRYLAFLDADDVWLPDKLERQVALLEGRPDVAMTYGPSWRWHGWTGRPSDALRDRPCATGLPPGTAVEPPHLLAHFLRRRGEWVPAICSLLVRREVAEAVGGFAEEFHDLFEDQAFLARVCLEHRVLVTGECTDRYRQHADSCCATAAARGDYDPELPNPARGRYLRFLAELVAARGGADPELARALRRELRPYGPPLASWPFARLPRLARRGRRAARAAVRRTLPAPLPRWIKARLRGRAYVPPPGWVRFGSLRRLTPLSRAFGYDRGLPVDRHYIERFLAEHAADVRGATLEVGDHTYTRRFGGARVTRADVLHVRPGAPGATLIADLGRADPLPREAFDCILLTQTLHLVYDVRAAVAALHRMLRPGGVLLATLPGLSQVDAGEWRDSWYWSFTALSARRLFESAFPAGSVAVESWGNVLAATAFLHGVAAGELRPHELEHRDPCYPLLVTVRAVKPAPAGAARMAPAGARAQAS